MPVRPPIHGQRTQQQARAYEQQRGSPSARGYDAAWVKFRAWYASQHPAICVECGAALASRDMHLDHIVPLADGGERLSEDNCQWLCVVCHGAKPGERRFGHVGKAGAT